MIDTPDVHIFSALIRISYQSSSGVESESTKEKNYEDVAGLYFFFLVSCKEDVGRSVGRSVVCSFIRSFVPSLSFRDSKFLPFHRHSSFVVCRSSTYLTTASLVLVANRRFFCFLSTCNMKGVATFASGGENRGKDLSILPCPLRARVAA